MIKEAIKQLNFEMNQRIRMGTKQKTWIALRSRTSFYSLLAGILILPSIAHADPTVSLNLGNQRTREVEQGTSIQWHLDRFYFLLSNRTLIQDFFRCWLRLKEEMPEALMLRHLHAFVKTISDRNLTLKQKEERIQNQRDTLLAPNGHNEWENTPLTWIHTGFEREIKKFFDSLKGKRCTIFYDAKDHFPVIRVYEKMQANPLAPFLLEVSKGWSLRTFLESKFDYRYEAQNHDG